MRCYTLRHSPLLSPSLTRDLSLTSITTRTLFDHIYSGSFARIFNSDGSFPLVKISIPIAKALHGDSASMLDITHRQDFSIHKVSYAVRLSPRSKCFSAPISMGAVMDSDGYLCTSISTIMRYYLSSYEEITMCKSYDYGDLKYPRP